MRGARGRDLKEELGRSSLTSETTHNSPVVFAHLASFLRELSPPPPRNSPKRQFETFQAFVTRGANPHLQGETCPLLVTAHKQDLLRRPFLSCPPSGIHDCPAGSGPNVSMATSGLASAFTRRARSKRVFKGGAVCPLNLCVQVLVSQKIKGHRIREPAHTTS